MYSNQKSPLSPHRKRIDVCNLFQLFDTHNHFYFFHSPNIRLLAIEFMQCRKNWMLYCNWWLSNASLDFWHFLVRLWHFYGFSVEIIIFYEKGIFENSNITDILKRYWGDPTNFIFGILISLNFFFKFLFDFWTFQWPRFKKKARNQHTPYLYIQTVS